AATRFPRRYARARRPTSRSSPRPDDTSRNEPIDLGQQVILTTQSHQENEMSKKVAYVTGGMGGIGTAVCRRLHDTGYLVIAGCGPSRDFNKWLGEQKADGYEFVASVGNVADWDSTKAAFDKVKAEHGNPEIVVNNAG